MCIYTENNTGLGVKGVQGQRGGWFEVNSIIKYLAFPGSDTSRLTKVYGKHRCKVW